jgi:hypothetical protein
MDRITKVNSCRMACGSTSVLEVDPTIVVFGDDRMGVAVSAGGFVEQPLIQDTLRTE